MDRLIDAAARCLAVGDPIGALRHVALRADAPALALRGIAMAQLGEFTRARALLRAAARAFGPRAVVPRARCIVAEGEVALASRDLAWPSKALEAARATLAARGDQANAAHARYLQARRFLLIGRLREAARTLALATPAPVPPAARTVYELVLAGIHARQLRTGAAREALARATAAAIEARIPALMAEVEGALRSLNSPAARRISAGREEPLLLDDVEALVASKTFIVDACRRAVRHSGKVVALARRPVLFTLVRALAEAWPGDAPRELLVLRAFRFRRMGESQRARLRVEVGRLRRVLAPLADVPATERGFVLAPRRAGGVVVLAPPVDEEDAEVLALLGDGESWSTSGLALALGTSQRTLQRALESLASAGKVQASGRGRARRWSAAALPGFATSLLLPASLPID